MRVSLTVILMLCLVLTLAQKPDFKVKSKKTKENGRTVRYCLYKGIQILPGGVFQDLDTCHRCKCKRKALVCHTKTKRKGGRADYAKGCIPITAGCKKMWVNRKDRSQVCDRI